MRKLLGYLSISVPFIGIAAFAIYSIGILKTLAVFGITGLIVGFIWLGVCLTT